MKKKEANPPQIHAERGSTSTRLEAEKGRVGYKYFLVPELGAKGSAVRSVQQERCAHHVQQV